MNEFWIVEFSFSSHEYPDIFYFRSEEKAKEFYEKRTTQTTSGMKLYWTLTKGSFEDDE